MMRKFVFAKMLKVNTKSNILNDFHKHANVRIIL